MTRAQSGQHLAGRAGQSGRGGLLNGFRGYFAKHYARVLFMAVFVLPSLLAAIYLSLVASDQYYSETRFLVRSLEKPAAQGAAAYLQDFGILRASDDAFAIQEYVRSRDLMHAVMAEIDLRKVWNPPGADFYSRYGSILFPDSDEALYRHFLRNVTVEKNLETGITTVRVYAYSAKDAQAIAKIILARSEGQVNAMNVRARSDSLTVAERASQDAAQKLLAANVALTQQRQRSSEIDPKREAGAAVERNSTLEGEIASLEVTLQTMRARAPANPAIPAMVQRLNALKAEAATQRQALTGSQTAAASPMQGLAGKLDEMNRLEAEAEIAERTYEDARKQLANAQEEFARQQVFVEEVAAPSLPDVPLEPRRWRYFFTVTLLAFWTFLILYLLVSGSREHLNLH
ncbi:hypothetical protein [Novosphingobium sp.]|uniref:hypothetical protein n=1 Tax=Novosphingobium sp. TaxID=1874826 RepID=UPI001D501E66|nr:hypothetical protein [Novosphingobium sp.]MBX9663910.1 hypothetical protein [Novosphingobium sp.]